MARNKRWKLSFVKEVRWSQNMDIDKKSEHGQDITMDTDTKTDRHTGLYMENFNENLQKYRSVKSVKLKRILENWILNPDASYKFKNKRSSVRLTFK